MNQKEITSNANLKKEIGDKLNKNSRNIFISMIILIAISTVIAVYKGMTREKIEFKIESITKSTSNEISNDFQQIGKSYSNYQDLRDLDNKLNYLLEKEVLSSSDSIEIIRLYEQLKTIK